MLHIKAVKCEIDNAKEPRISVYLKGHMPKKKPNTYLKEREHKFVFNCRCNLTNVNCGLWFLSWSNRRNKSWPNNRGHNGTNSRNPWNWRA
jgi:hypothetical protein